MAMIKKVDVETVVIGTGVIGAAVARSLLRQKHGRSVALLEKERAPALHTSGRNSGVVHSGFNLKPGSLKARFCVEGNRRLREFCSEQRIPHDVCGTVVTALSLADEQVLHELLERGKANGVPGIRLITARELKNLEPHAAGLAGLQSPSAAITSGRLVTEALVNEVVSMKGRVFFDAHVKGIEPRGQGYRIRTATHEFNCAYLINCGGLYADEIAHLMNVGRNLTIVPFRGEYFKLSKEKSGVLRSMLYPVPDLRFPFLGVHWTKSIDGEAMIGPNAMMAFGRESYRLFDIHLKDVVKMAIKRNFWAMWGNPEFKRLFREQIKLSLSRSRFIEEARKLIPGVAARDFVRGKSGNRAQVVDHEGRMIDDIVVFREGASLHVLNAVSPGFTCALPFADDLVQRHFQ